MQFKNIAELKQYKEQKKLDKFNKKQDIKAQRKEFKKQVMATNKNKCSVCGGEGELKVKSLLKPNKLNASDAMVFCKSCRMQRKINPALFYWTLVKKYPAHMKKYLSKES